MTASATVLLAGGGTAGHVFPALAVGRALAASASACAPEFIGTADRLEGRLVPEAGFTLHHIDALPLPRRPSLGLFRLPGALRQSVRRCKRIIEETDAGAVATFGGYVGFPVALAARSLDVPLIVHEQNSVPGLANRIAGRWADRVAVTFPGSVQGFSRPDRVAVTGNPVREEILAIDPEADRAAALKHFGLHKNRRTLLVFGGSQGARSLNGAAIASYGRWTSPKRLQILHGAGQALYEETLAGWEEASDAGEGPLVRCFDFIDDMAAAYVAADIVLCRAGATSVAELTAIGRASVLVPYPHATADHQRYNAAALERVGAARMIFDRDLDGRRLVSTVQPLLDDHEQRDAMASAAGAFGRRDAAENVARLIERELQTVRTVS